MNLELSREILEIALKLGGQVLMEHFDGDRSTRRKESISSVVTDADLASEKAIIGLLDSSFETCNIISEEAGYLERNSDYTWVIDPLDGTSNFAAGLPWFGVIIALFKSHEPVLGGMYLPVQNALYIAQKGKGAWKNDISISTTRSSTLEDQLISYSFDFSNEDGKTSGEMALMEKLSNKVRNIRSINSLIDFCYTADGRLGAAINQTTRIWDISAAWLIIREAGGKVTDISGNEICFNLSPSAVDHNYTIVASGTGLHEHLISLINP